MKIILGFAVLLLGFPIGDLLARYTSEELDAWRGLFKILILISMGGAIIGLILKNDFLLFSSLFINIVTSRSLKKQNVKKRIKKPSKH